MSQVDVNGLPALQPLNDGGDPGRTIGQRLLNVLPWAALESIAITLLGILVSMVLFGVFVLLAGHSPFEVYELMYKGAFGTSFAWGNTLTRAAPLLLTGLCTALPARLGMVIIGGEGALVMGGLSAAAVATAVSGASPAVTISCMFLAGSLVGGLWIAAAGALKQFRGVNETICSLLLIYIAVAILNHMVDKGPMWDPSSLNNPSSHFIGDANRIGKLPGIDVHWGLVIGIVACLICWVLMDRTTLGFAASIVGGNARAAKMAGLSIASITLIVSFLAGAAAGIAGVTEVAAVHGRANANLAVGYGYTGILVAFLARHNPLAIIPVAVLIGGISAGGGRLQKSLMMPDATALVFQGILFLVVLVFETLYGRLKFLQRREAKS
ncbi:ABC transporter permease [Humisphaera borealis]|uniref:ABC transporter permease n=1 Tax=Humisphaera borealis TaxID=2807512 RepID=A0A7M2WUZ4_9BACT|nr:ABC transporter permease [Humisphaera borealis]QOV89358.1 ABC transporter permease [Humisphaera borealis]